MKKYVGDVLTVLSQSNMDTWAPVQLLKDQKNSFVFCSGHSKMLCIKLEIVIKVVY